MYELGLCITVNSYVENMFYAWLFRNNKLVTIDIKNNKYFIYLNTHTTVFYCRANNSNTNLM